jgi:SAM-dependent methyltransferase
MLVFRTLMHRFSQLEKYFDDFIEWDKRLSFEMPFILKTLEEGNCKSVLDFGCGPGRHSLVLSEAGYKVAGLDRSDYLVGLASNLAEEKGLDITFLNGDISSLEVSIGSFDSCIMLGNTIPLIGDTDGIKDSICLVRNLLSDGGVIMAQMPNYAQRIADRDPSIRFRKVKLDGKPGLLIKTRTYLDNGNPDSPDVVLHLIVIREKDGKYEFEDNIAEINAVIHSDLEEIFSSAGFEDIRFYGSMNGSEFIPLDSDDCVIVARKPGK